jgi:hypothetical protein
VALEVNTSASKSNRNESRDATFVGPVWYHYLGETGKSKFFVLGLGLLALSYHDLECDLLTDCPKKNAFGLGYHLGLGYEFKKHWQVTVFLTAGTAESIFNWGTTDRGFEVSCVKVLISFFAY